MYNKNICCHYMSSCIIETNIFFIHESVYRVIQTMYNKNICCHYIRRHIMTTNIFFIHKSVYRLIRDDV